MQEVASKVVSCMNSLRCLINYVSLRQGPDAPEERLLAQRRLSRLALSAPAFRLNSAHLHERQGNIVKYSEYE